MVKRVLLPFLVVCAFVMVGCSKTETNENMSAGNSNSNKAAASTNSSGANGTTATSSTASSGEKIGIPDCDDFIAKYEACTSKVPEAGRAAWKDAMVKWRDAWKKAAENPATKAALASQCKQIADAQKTTLKMYGCEL
jgi:hypothetical protein